MKKIIASAFLIFLVSFSIVSTADESVDFKNDWPVVSLNERTVKELLDNKADVYLIDFWASWCEPCLESLPFYMSELKKLNLTNWTLVAINVDSDKSAALDFLKKIQLPTWVLFDEKRKLGNKLNVTSIPVLYFVNRKGEILKIEKGFTKKSKETFRKNVEAVKSMLRHTTSSRRSSTQLIHFS